MDTASATSQVAAQPLFEWLASELDPQHRRLVLHCEPDVVLTAEKAALVMGAAREAISNALRHAYPMGSDGKVWVRLHGHDRLTLSVRDMGKGLPHLEGKPHPGIDAIEGFAHDLGGFARIDNRNYGGAEITVVFPAH